MDKRAQNKFLSDMYDDFFNLTAEAFKAARERDRQLKYNKSRIPKIDAIGSKEELLARAKMREVIQHETSQVRKDVEPVQLEKETTNIPKIEVKNEEEAEKQEEPVEVVEELTEEQKQAKLEEFYDRVEEAHLTDESKLVLKKMIDYARKYKEGIVKDYIPFNMRIYTNDDETLYSIVNIIIDSFYYYDYMKNDEAVERSFFVVDDDASNITDLYNAQTSLVVFKDVDGLNNKEKAIKDKLLNVFEKTIYEYSNLEGITTIITDTCREKIDDLFSTSITLRDKVFDFELETLSSTNQEVYQNIISNLKEKYTLSSEFEVKLLDYINETYNKTTINSTEYEKALIEKILFNQETNVIDSESIPKYERNKSTEEIFEELDSLVGLDNVKQMLRDLVSLMKFKSKAGDSVKVKDTNLHMVFLGNPGTGKTTVARMVAGILYNLGYIEQNKLIEVSAKDLIGQYVGQTAPKTMGVIEKALGGVLFIDEAYSLASGAGSSGNSFNEECIATLIQAMENYRDNLVVIFAGYTKEMDAFLKSNSGIVSRIGYTMEFKDYTVDELIEIFKSMFKKAGFTVEKSAINKAKEIVEEYRHTEGFGNARFVRNLYEKAIIKHATNTQDTKSKKVLRTITADDITAENILKM